MLSLASIVIVVLTRLSTIHIVITQAVDLVTRGGDAEGVFVVGGGGTLCH